jgi:hypothetical protein
MPTLYVENVPEDLYEAIRTRAQAGRSSISAVVLNVLAESVPTPKEIARRRALLQRSRAMRARPPVTPGIFPSSEAMLREDRER